MSCRESGNSIRQHAALHRCTRFSQSTWASAAKAYLACSGSCRTTPMPLLKKRLCTRSAISSFRASSSSIVRTHFSARTSTSANRKVAVSKARCVLETATFLFALVEVLAEKGVLTIEELDARKDEIAD